MIFQMKNLNDCIIYYPITNAIIEKIMNKIPPISVTEKENIKLINSINHLKS